MTAQAHVDVRDGVAHLTVQGRSDLNLLGRQAFSALEEAMERVSGDPRVRAVVLRGAGRRAFSAGVDLHEMKTLTPLDAESFIQALHRVARRVLTLPQPVIAAVRGPCLGGALELALACDLRIATPDALFGLPEVRVGLPSVIEASLLAPTVGLGRARALVLTGETVSAQQALEMGLVHRVVPADDLEEAAREAARQFLTISPYVLSVQKDIIAKWLELGEADAAEYSIKAFALCFASPDPREAMEAFLQKRAPRF